MTGPPIVLDAEAVRVACPPERAAEAVERALVDGLDPAGEIARVAVALEHGHLLLMPSGAHPGFRTPGIGYAGVKVAAVAAGNPRLGQPRIQATYLLLDGATLAPLAVVDGTALTTLRTPATSIAAVRRHLLAGNGPLTVVVIGAGPQGLGHAQALHASIGPHRPVQITHLVRDPARVIGPSAQLGAPDAERLLRTADVVVCATSARTPLFDSALLGDHAVVIAVGSHESGAREVDAALCGRATVVVEDRAVALREAGDVVMAVDEGAITPDDLVPMSDVVLATAQPPLDRPLLFKSVGMSWEDLVVASAVFEGRRR
jgi:ornithine cyclodeaminase/alanine dehydrogenase-like protein (mu-crystallin family)